jgi:thioester reductase-like protein
MRLLVAGLTGQLGHGLVEVAADAGAEIVPLVRPLPRRAAGERVARAFGDAELAARTLAGDVGEPFWRLDAGALDRLAPEVDAVVDLAGEVDWTARDGALFRTNVTGALHGLAIARALHARGGRCRLYCLASSVYVAGARRGRIPEARLGADATRTRYEQTKWHGERSVLDASDGVADGPRALVARVGGLVGSSSTGATLRRNSLYLLADEWDRLPGGLLPRFGDGRVDMLPRDVAAALLLRAVRAAVDAGEAAPEVVHVCAGESAPRTDAVLEVAASLDAGARLRRVRRVPVPERALVAASLHAGRFLALSRPRGNAVVGVRYLTIERIFERDRLAALVGGELPAASAEQIARLAFGLEPAAARPAGDPALARYRE